MTGANDKSAQKRKSLAGEAASPKKAKIANNLNKSKGGEATPAKGKTPNKQNPKTPKSAVKVAGPGAKKEVTSPKALPKFPGTAAKTQGKDKKAKALKQKLNGTGDKKKKGTFYHLQKSVKDKANLSQSIAAIEARIAEIEGREEKSKTALRKLKLLKNLKLRAENGGEMPAFEQPKPATGNQKKEKKKTKKDEAKAAKQKAVKPAKTEELIEAEVNSEESYEEEEASDEEASDDVDEEEISGEEDSDDVDEEEESDEEDEEDGSDEEEDESEKKVVIKAPGDKKPANGVSGKDKKRFVLFIGNLPYDVTKEEVTEHFAKVGKIRDVRIPSGKETNKPRGFAYLEVENEVAYQKALSMHQTTVKGRKINVAYSEGGKKKGETKKSDIKAKNFKLHAMRKQGQLAGSSKKVQKRSIRRAKAKAAA